MFRSVKRISSTRLAAVFGALLLATAGFGYVGGSSPAFAAVQEEFYVSPTGSDSNDGTSVASPFQTLEKARQAVDAINDNMTGDIVVYLLEGTYTLTSAFTVDGGDSGSNGFNVIYKDYEQDAGEAVVSGGVDLDTLTANWQVHDAANNIYKLAGVDWAFRQLYVNGDRAVRAREPDLTNEATGGGYTSTTDNDYPFNILTSQIDPWWNGTTHSGVVEFVWNAHWNQIRARIHDYTPVPNTNVSTVTFKSPESTFPLDHHPNDTTFFYLENAYELLDTQGEWFLDKVNDILYYKPRIGETMGTTEVIAPKTNVLVNLNGTATNPVQHIQFYGIAFRYNNWTTPDQYGYYGLQGGYIYGVEVFVTPATIPPHTRGRAVPGIVEVRYSNDIRFERNTFESGGSWGIMEYEASHDNTYIGNHFRDLSSGAITIGNNPDLYKYEGELSPGTGENDIISNNLIEYVGREYRDSGAIMALQVKHMTIEHNEIRNVGYTGISVGFQHSDSCEQDSHHNIVRLNRIQHVMQALDDGAGIYTLGCMSEAAPPNDSLFHRNFVYNLYASPYTGWHQEIASNLGIYLDGAAAYQTYQHNVVDNTSKSFFASNQGGPKEHDNIGQYNHYNIPHAIYNDPQFDPPFSVWQSNEEAQGSSWSSVAESIMNAAGLEETYEGIGQATHGFNVAEGKTASASSVWSGNHAAANAVDNDVSSGLWASDATQLNPYWQVDLGRKYRINQVDVVARQDTDQAGARKYFEVQASNNADFSSYTVLASQDSVAFVHKGTWSAYVNDTGSYRYLRVQRTNNFGHFNFAEFRAFGGPAIPTNGMQLWLRADAGVTRDANDTVSGWADQSPSGNNDAAQATLAQQPQWIDDQILSRPVIRFDGSNDNLSVPGLIGDMDDFTLLFVLRPDTTTDHNQHIQAAGGWTGEFGFHTTDNGSIYVGTSASSRIVPSDGPGAGTMVDDQFQQFTYCLDTGTAVLYKNGSSLATKSVADPADWTGFQLGLNSTNTIHGDIAEVIIYNRALSTAERQSVEEYLATKYWFPSS